MAAIDDMIQSTLSNWLTKAHVIQIVPCEWLMCWAPVRLD